MLATMPYGLLVVLLTFAKCSGSVLRHHYSGIIEFIDEFCSQDYNYTLFVDEESLDAQRILGASECSYRISRWSRQNRAATASPIDDFTAAYKVIILNLDFHTVRDIVSKQYSPLQRQVDFICQVRYNSSDPVAPRIPFSSQISGSCCQTMHIVSEEKLESVELSAYRVPIAASSGGEPTFLMSKRTFKTACLECGFVRRVNDAYTYMPTVSGSMVNVGYINTTPHFIVQRDNVTGELKEDKGTEINMMRMFSKYYNFTYKLEPEPNLLYGSMRNDAGTPKWVGLIGWVYNKEKDISLSELGMSFSRLGAVTFSWPYIIDLITYAHPAPGRLESYKAMLWPFDITAWGMILLMLIMCSVVVLTFRGPSIRQGRYPEFWLLLALIVRQTNEGYREYTRLSYRTFLLSWLIFGFYISNLYCSSLLSLLSMPVFEPEVRSLDQLYTAIKKKRFRCGTQVSTTIYDVLQIYQHKVAELIKKQMVEYPELVTGNKETSILEIPSKRYCFIDTRNFMKAFVFENKLENLVRVPEYDYFYTFLAGTAFQKKCCLIEKFNKAIHPLVASGLWAKWLADGMMEKKIMKTEGEAVPISNTPFMGPYMLLGGGCIVALITFLIEMRRPTCLRKKSRRIQAHQGHHDHFTGVTLDHPDRDRNLRNLHVFSTRMGYYNVDLPI